MKRAIVLALSVILALTMAAPTVLAQGNGGAPEDVSEDPFTVNPGDIPGTCSFSMLFELSGKTKTIVQGNGGMIITSPGLDVTVTNLANGEQATFNITGSLHNSTDTPEPGQVTTLVSGRNFLFDPEAG